MLRRSLMLSTIAALLFGAGAVVMAQAGSSRPAPMPPWVDSDHGVDVGKLPDLVPVGGPDGSVVGYVDSKSLMGGPVHAPVQGEDDGVTEGDPGATHVDPRDTSPVVMDAAGRPVGSLTSEGFRAKP